MRVVVGLLVLGVVLVGGAFVGAGYMAAPTLAIAAPGPWVGAATPLDVTVTSADAAATAIAITFEQNGTRTTLFDRRAGGDPGPAAPDLRVEETDAGTLRVVRTISPALVPGLAGGAARIHVDAARAVLWGLRRRATTVTHEVTVRLEKPRVSVLSTHHYVNVGGAEMVVYRVSPEDVESGVVVGDLEYPGYPAAGARGAGLSGDDPGLRVAFFAVLHDQPVTTPIRVYARDLAGNSARADVESRVFPKPFKQSRIEVDDRLLERVVPAILAGTTEIAPAGPLIEQFVAINSDLRARNAATIASWSAKTSPDLLWRGTPFHPFRNNAVESAFADRRTYVYQGKEVDRQVHLGFDLASVARAPIVAANHGRVLFAGELGIYGNAVIIDHGMGLQSLYAHLSAVDVAAGADVARDQVIGRSGLTGLAAGDHLHFTMLVAGRMVNPVEWWDPHWIEDRILRKLREAR